MISPIIANFDTWGFGGIGSSSVLSAIQEGCVLPCRLKLFTESLLFTSTGSDTPKGSSRAVCVGDSLSRCRAGSRAGETHPQLLLSRVILLLDNFSSVLLN